MKKIYRLKKNHEIATIVKKKQRIVKNNYIVYYQYTLDKMPKIALSVSKKYGKAVERNKAKRIARVIIHESIRTLSNVSLVIVIKPCSNGVDFTILKEELNSILKRIILNQSKGVEKWKLKANLNFLFCVSR